MKFVTVFGLFAAIVFGGFICGQAIGVDEAKPIVTTLFQDFINIIGDAAKANTQALLGLFNQQSYADMAALTETAQSTFNQYHKYFENAGFYNKPGYEDKLNSLKSALAKYQEAFSGESDFPLKSSVATLKAKLK